MRALSALALALALLCAAAMLRASASDGGTATPADEGRAAIRVERGIAYQGTDKPKLTVYRPRGLAGRAPAVMAVHGGTWTHGDGGKMHGFAKAIARHGFVVFKVGYTYATRKRAGFPRQRIELRRAIRWMRAHARRFRIDPSRIGALGSSSGAHLVALTAMYGRAPLTRGARVKAAVVWSAPLNLTRLRKGWLARAIRKFVGCQRWCKRTLRRASPIHHVSRGDPALLMFNGDRELLPLSQPRSMATKLRAARVPHRVSIIGSHRHGAKNADVLLAPSIGYLREQLDHPVGGGS